MSRTRVFFFSFTFALLSALTAHCGDDATPNPGAPDASLDARVPDARTPEDATVDTNVGDAEDASDATDSASMADAMDAADATDAVDADAAADAGAHDAGCLHTLCDGACVDLMKDPQHCGSCDFTCGVGETCEPVLYDSGISYGQCRCPSCDAPITLTNAVSMLGRNGEMAIADGALYLGGLSVIARLPLPANGLGTPETLFDLRTFDAGAGPAADEFAGMGFPTVTGSHVFVATGGGAVFSLARQSPYAETTLALPGFALDAIAADDTYVYYTDRDHDTVWRAPVTGGGGRILIAYEHAPHSLVLLGDRLFWLANGHLRWAPKAGGTAHDGAGVNGAYLLAAGGGNIFFATSSSIGKYDVATDSVQTLASIHEYVEGMFATPSRVFWSEVLGAIRVVGADGSGEHTIALGEVHPHSIVADDTYAYWYVYETTSVRRARY